MKMIRSAFKIPPFDPKFFVQVENGRRFGFPESHVKQSHRGLVDCKLIMS